MSSSYSGDMEEQNADNNEAMDEVVNEEEISVPTRISTRSRRGVM